MSLATAIDMSLTKKNLAEAVKILAKINNVCYTVLAFGCNVIFSFAENAKIERYCGSVGRAADS